MVWLLLIPCFNLVWNFFVFLRLADSYKSYFDAQGVTDVGDCGRNIYLAYCIAAVLSILSFIPCIGMLIGLAVLVLLILSLVKANELRNRIPPEAETVEVVSE